MDDLEEQQEAHENLVMPDDLSGEGEDHYNMADDSQDDEDDGGLFGDDIGEDPEFDMGGDKGFGEPEEDKDDDAENEVFAMAREN